MKHSMKHITLAIATLLCMTSAQAEFISGNKLLSMLESDDSTETAIATGYITGAWDSMTSIKICAPA